MIGRFTFRRGAAGPRPFAALRCRQAAGPLIVRLFLGFGLAVIAVTLLAAAARAEDSEAKPAPEVLTMLARIACHNATRDAYWQAVATCLALESAEDRRRCGAAARAVRQDGMARCALRHGQAPEPAP